MTGNIINKYETDREIVEGLIRRDNEITRHFFYVSCRPLLTTIIRLIFSYPVEYNEIVSELYSYLMEDNAAKLRQFQYRSSLYQWLKVVATRFFIQRRNSLIEDKSREEDGQAVYSGENITDPSERIGNRMDVKAMLDRMDNRRYADVINHLIVRDEEPEQYASRIGVTVDNLYNIKRRALISFAQVVKRNYHYER